MISDVLMQTMDGPTTVRHARKTHPNLPILFISGYAEEQLRNSIDLERVSFLAKPFSVQKLAEAARDTLLAKRSEEHTSELQSLMRISYAVFFLTKKNTNKLRIHTIHKT